MSEHSVGGVERGCGSRVEGGIYAECGLSKKGQPLENFIVCPPVHVDHKALGLTPVGVHLQRIEEGGVTHVFDWVGAEFYPNIADFLEEVRRFGMSRRLPKTLDFSSLDGNSRMLLVHKKAIITDQEPYHLDRIGGKAFGKSWEFCPKDIADHAEPDVYSMCAGLWWEDLEGLDFTSTEATLGDRYGIRSMPSFSYNGVKPPENSSTGYELGIFASFPISRLSVIRAQDGSHEDAAKAASKAGLDVDVVED